MQKLTILSGLAYLCVYNTNTPEIFKLNRDALVTLSLRIFNLVTT